MKFAISTLGCRLNFAETEEMIELLEKKKFEFSLKKPKLIIVRGCLVTKKAEKETKLKIKEWRKKRKKAFIIAAGCLRENFSSPAADLIFPKNKEKDLLKRIEELEEEKKLIRQKTPTQLKTRSFIKIQDGCQNFCSYCLIPFLRGKEKSRSSQEIIEKIKEKEKQGFKEVVLTGVNIGQWQEIETKKEKLKSKNFIWLLKKIFKETLIKRIRISSLWPEKVNSKLLSLFKNPRLCRHLHLSCQSFSDSVLKGMARNYKVREIKNKIKKIKKIFPDLTITSDVIVGFPGETDEKFNETVKNLKEINLAKIHVFRYSSHKETPSSYFKGQVEEKIKKKRAKILLSLSKKLNKNWRKKFLGKTREVLFEKRRNDFWQGLTDNYLKVFVKSKRNLANQIISVKLERLYKDGILGKALRVRVKGNNS